MQIFYKISGLICQVLATLISFIHVIKRFKTEREAVFAVSSPALQTVIGVILLSDWCDWCVCHVTWLLSSLNLSVLSCSSVSRALRARSAASRATRLSSLSPASRVQRRSSKARSSCTSSCCRISSSSWACRSWRRRNRGQELHKSRVWYGVLGLWYGILLYGRVS